MLMLWIFSLDNKFKNLFFLLFIIFKNLFNKENLEFLCDLI